MRACQVGTAGGKLPSQHNDAPALPAGCRRAALLAAPPSAPDAGLLVLPPCLQGVMEESSEEEESSSEEEEGSNDENAAQPLRPTRRAAKAAGRAIRQQAGAPKRRKNPKRAAAPGASRLAGCVSVCCRGQRWGSVRSRGGGGLCRVSLGLRERLPATCAALRHQLACIAPPHLPSCRSIQAAAGGGGQL